jgi:hypothetical protein
MDNEISVDCKLIRGRDLARTFGFPQKFGKDDAVYAFGFVRNATGKTAYVRFSLDGGDTIPGETAEVTVGMIPPRGRAGEPFLVRLTNLVSDDVHVDEIKPVIHILETRYK